MSSARDVEAVDAQAHAVAVRIAEVEGVGGAVHDRHPRGAEALLPLVQAVDREGEHVSRARLRAGPLELPLEHQHRGPRGEPDREQGARLLLEPPQLAEAEKVRVEGPRALDVLDPEGDVVDHETAPTSRRWP